MRSGTRQFRPSILIAAILLANFDTGGRQLTVTAEDPPPFRIEADAELESPDASESSGDAAGKIRAVANPATPKEDDAAGKSKTEADDKGKATTEDAAKDPLLGAVLEAVKKFQPVTESDVEAARASTAQSLSSLEQYLRSNAPTRGEGWRKFLDTDGLSEELDGAEMPNLQRVARIYNRFISGEPGLELVPFQDTAEKLRVLLERLQLRESEPERIAESKERFIAALDNLEAFLKTGSAEKQKGWKEFLRWDDLRDIAQAEKLDPRDASRALSLFNDEQAGLDRPEFRRVARTLTKLVELAQLARQPRGQERYQKRIEQLADTLKAYRKQPTNDGLAAISSSLVWLEQIGQQAELVAMFRESFSKPNFFIGVSGFFVSQQMGQSVDRCEPVVRCFEGSTIRACAKSCGEATANLVPCEDAAMIELRVQAMIYSNGVAQKRRVFVSTSNRTSVMGRKEIMLTEEGILACPACADAVTASNICGVCVDRNCATRVIERGAKKKANESRGRAQDFASNDASCTLRNRMDDEAAQMLPKANQRLAELRSRLKQLDLYPDNIKLYSTGKDIRIDGKTLSKAGLGAASDPPSVIPAGDVIVRVHQSLINDIIASRLGGIKIDNESIVTLMEQNNIPVPEELKKGSKKKPAATKAEEGDAGNTNSTGADAADENQIDGTPETEGKDESWSMTFDRDLPATVTFEDGIIRIGIRGRKFGRADQTINEKINISSAYRIVRDGEKDFALEREGEVLVEFVGARNRLSTRQLSYKVFLERKFGAMFQERISRDQLPKSDAMQRLDQINIDSVDSLRGWFMAGISAKGRIPRNQ